MTSPATIVHLIANLKTGGAQSILERLVLFSRHRHVVVSMGALGVVGQRMAEQGVLVLPLGMEQPFNALLALPKLVRILRHHRADVLQTWLYPADFLGLLAGKLAGVNRIYWNIRCSLVQVERRTDHHYWLPRVLAPLASRVDGVVVNSQEGVRDHQTLGYRPKQWHLIANGVDVAKFCPDPNAKTLWRQRLGIPPGAILVGMVARYHPMKGYATFIAAAGKMSGVHFVMAGRGVTVANQELMALVAATGIPECFHLVGEIDQVGPLMAALDFLVSASHYGEGFSNALGEAMACGVAVVATRCGDAATILPEGSIVVAGGDEQALLAGMNQCLALGEAGRQALGEAGRQRMVSLFSLAAMIHHYENLWSPPLATTETDGHQGANGPQANQQTDPPECQ